MRYLLDTHVLLWWRQDDPRLPAHWDAILNNSKQEHEIYFSVVSIWEIAIKRTIGKLELQIPTADFARTLESDHRFRQLPLEVHEICRMETLPYHHRDPFDRLLIAQACELSAIAVTDDARWTDYAVQVDF